MARAGVGANGPRVDGVHKRSAVEDGGLAWPAELLRHGAEILTNTDDLLAALPDAGPAFADLAF